MYREARFLLPLASLLARPSSCSELSSRFRASTTNNTRVAQYYMKLNIFQKLKMSDKAALQPMKRTNESLKQIKATLTPFLTLLDKYHNQTSDSSKSNFNKQEITEAEAAVALAMGTLRYMAHRLKGQAKGQKKNDPLRMELDKMRKTLVQCKALRKDKEEELKKKENNIRGGSASKRRRTDANNLDGTPKQHKKKKAKK